MMHLTETTPERHRAGAIELFERTCATLRGDAVHDAMNGLSAGLQEMRTELPPDAWRDVGATLRRHKLHLLLHHSPLVQRTFEASQRDANDPKLVDLVCGCGPRPRDLTTLGEALYAWEFESSGCRSIRYRRLQLAREIDRVVGDFGRASVLSIACGHLRELELSAAAREGRLHCTAIDEDRDAVALAAREYGVLGVSAYVGTAPDVTERLKRLNFQLAYAAGLYNRLETAAAQDLTAALFRTLAPGGRLLISNFTPETRDAGYAEACLGQRRVYRDQRQMETLLQFIPDREIGCLNQFLDPDGNIGYLRVVRL